MVVVVHGLNRTSRAMEKMAKALAQEGYTVLNCNYPSHKESVATLADGLHKQIAPRIAKAERVHFVTHSMGGIVLRKMAQEHPLENMGRVVMLAPPNQGSEMVDALGSWRAYQWVNGPAGNELGTSSNSTPFQLGAPAFPIGIIAGDRTVNPLFSWIIPGPDDGKVAVERTKVEGMDDFLCLHVTHTWMMRNPHVIRQTAHFLKTGHFETAVR
ncbi:MAG: alpha/beta fold hydrolase [Kiritimatiellaeota bacterium]|nr:alpha/beta fold hydrolase [Kiritimatiellota bacterium]